MLHLEFEFKLKLEQRKHKNEYLNDINGTIIENANEMRSSSLERDGGFHSSLMYPSSDLSQFWTKLRQFQFVENFASNKLL